jgi:hypothetical protein
MRMIYKTWAAEIPVAHILFTLIFFSGCHTTPDMALLLIHIQNLPHLLVQREIVLFQSVGQIFMYGGFGNTEMPGGGPDSGAGFNHVHSQLTGPLLQWF